MRRPAVNIIFIFVCFCLFLFSALSHSNDRRAYSITLSDDIINPVSAEYISKAIEKANEDGAEFLIIKLDTPGGLLTSTRQIVKKMMSSNVPIIVYVAPSGSRAGSAGVFITLAANIAAMAPSTNIGAAHPVSLQERRSLGDAIEDLAEKLKKDEDKTKVEKKKEEKPADTMERKILSDTLAWAEGIAKERGRNLEWTEKAVTESISVTDEDALKNGVIDFVAKDMNQLLSLINGKKVKINDVERVINTSGVTIVEIPKTVRQKILSVLAIPNVAYILLMLGFYGLLFEFTHPGVGFPGVAGLMSAITALYGLHLLEANYAGIALIVLGIILFIMEIKIVSYGLLTLGGVTCLFLGSLMTFDSPYKFMRVSLPIIIAVSAATLGVVAFLATIVVKSHRKTVATGEEGMVGLIGRVTLWEGKEGSVFVHGEIWNAESEQSLLPGDNIEVVSVKGMKLKVKKV